MDFPQVLIPVIVVAPLILLIAFSMKRRLVKKRSSLPTLQPSPVHLLPRFEPTALQSTKVTREITLSANYERALALLINEDGWEGVLSQLPALPPFFVGRRAELARAFVLFDGPHPPSVLAITSARATAGIGRTGFATALAHLLAARYPDAQLFVDLRGDENAPLDVADAMRHVVRALIPGAPLPADPADLPVRYRLALEKRRVLLLIENARPQPYLELLHPPAGSLLLITSREPAAFSRIETITLEPFPRPEARAFLRASGTRLNRELDKHLDLLAELSGYLPAALKLNADRFQTDISQTIDAHFDQLKGAGAFQQPLAAARTLAGVPSAAGEVTAECASVEPVEMRTPPPEPEAPPDTGDPWKSRRAFVQRFQTHTESDFSLTDVPAAFADPSHGPAPDYADALHFLAEFPNTKAEHARDIAPLEAAVSAARALGDPAAEMRALAMLGKARVEAGEPRLAVACFERWVETARTLGDRRAETESLGWLGVGWMGSSLANRATGCFEAQVRVAREIGDRASEMQALGKLGHAKATLGDFQNAATHHADQLRIAMEIQDRAAELDALEHLGLAWTRLKEIEKAAGFHESLLLTARATGDLAAESRALGHLGQVAVHRGRIGDAIEKYEAQLDLASRIEDLTAQSHAHASLGVAWARQGDLRKAVAHYEQQLHIAQQTGNRLGEATALANIGSGRERLGDLTGAATAWEKALAIYESLGSPSADSMRRWLQRVRSALAGNGVHH